MNSVSGHKTQKYPREPGENLVFSSFVGMCHNSDKVSFASNQSSHDRHFFRSQKSSISTCTHTPSLPCHCAQIISRCEYTMAIQRTREQFELPQRQQRRVGTTEMKKLKPSSSKAKVGYAKSLRFSGFSTVVSLQPWSKEDRFNSWYSREEISSFKHERTHLVDALKDTRTATAMKQIAASVEHRATPPPIRIHNKELIRGIEKFISPEVARHILRKRRRAIHGVLQCQGKLEVESLAQAYRGDSRFAKEWTTLTTDFQDA